MLLLAPCNFNSTHFERNIFVHPFCNSHCTSSNTKLRNPVINSEKSSEQLLTSSSFRQFSASILGRQVRSSVYISIGQNAISRRWRRKIHRGREMRLKFFPQWKGIFPILDQPFFTMRCPTTVQSKISTVLQEPKTSHFQRHHHPNFL